MKIKLPKLCQKCSAEFTVVARKDTKGKMVIEDVYEEPDVVGNYITIKKRLFIDCPICGEKNLVYRVKLHRERVRKG